MNMAIVVQVFTMDASATSMCLPSPLLSWGSQTLPVFDSPVPQRRPHANTVG